MIKMRIYNSDGDMSSDFRRKTKAPNWKPFGVVWDADRHLGFFSKSEINQEPPFRDPESRKLMKVGDVEIIEDDWYSVLVRNYNKKGDKFRVSLTRIDYKLKYALTLLDFSRRNIYLSFERLEEEYWKALEEMPFDILVAIKGSDLCGFAGESVITNYPYRGKEIEVRVKSHIQRDDSFYEKIVSGGKEPAENMTDGFYNSEYALYKGKDGLYYFDDSVLRYGPLDYYWKNDLKGVIWYLEDYCKNKEQQKKRQQKIFIQLVDVDINNTYSLEEFQAILSAADPEMWDELLDCIKEPDRYQIPEIPEDFTVTLHLSRMMRASRWRGPMARVVEKQPDGTIKIFDKCIVSIVNGVDGEPNAEELIVEALALRKEGSDIFCLFSDEEYYKGVRDIAEFAIFGVRIQWNSLEIFDKDESIELFLAALKEYVGQEKEKA